jgi:hypothetical protein
MTGGSPAQHPRATAVLGVALGVAFAVCLVTGLVSDLIQEPRSWLTWPAGPRDLYRWTQGAHLVSGVVAIPLLLAKLLSVSRKLWVWPPARSLAHAVERLALVPLVGGSLLLLTGLLNVFSWYPFPFSFTTTHYWTAWITVGALLVHLGDGRATQPGNGSLLPNDYRRSLVLVLAPVWAVAVLGAARTSGRRRRRGPTVPPQREAP